MITNTYLRHVDVQYVHTTKQRIAQSISVAQASFKYSSEHFESDLNCT